ncbi:C40 family peptidase [Flexivirga oryzae]|uniref:Cell wall-associated NlpC family hydrolase n=1 Tax=Flexivirga oryzae TaxID=1794944 RepID=A0A839N8W3_9MICO|nr:NlpC/P60 family protein [Flexivirga oryzae]MBB2892076.1 cell wall-associated NlpC family hydrolase [Flexivirga oryzae]
MGSYSPRHLKRESKVLNKVGRRSLAVAAAGAVVVPLAGMENASAAPSAGLAQAGSVQAAGHLQAAGGLSTAVRIGPTVQYGSRGAAVKTVQRKVGGLAVDGIFGPRTKAKVKSFQRSHRLAIDGIVGRHTWTALGGYSSTPTTKPKPAPKSNSSIVSTALGLRGTPYRWGGTTPAGFDCSGFTQYVYRQAGKSIPRTASAQAAAATRVSNPRPGDLIFWGSPAYHNGIYLGNGKMIAARTPGTVVSVQNLWGNHYFARI